MKIDFPDYPIGPWEPVPWWLRWRGSERCWHWRWVIDYRGCECTYCWQYR